MQNFGAVHFCKWGVQGFHSDWGEGGGGNISEWGGMAYDQLCVCATYLSGLAKALQIPKNPTSTLEIVLIFLLADFSASVSFFLPALT